MAFSTEPLERVDQRVTRFVEAARQLGDETGTAAFTVPQLVSRAGLSLKSFYSCFEGKDDLLIAVLAADSEVGARLLGERIAAHHSAPARLRAYVDGIFEMLGDPRALGYAAMLVREHRRLEAARPRELAGALAPLVQLLAHEIAGLGEPRNGSDAAATADLVFALVLEGIHRVTLGQAEAQEVAARLWSLCWNGLAGGSTTKRSSR